MLHLKVADSVSLPDGSEELLYPRIRRSIRAATRGARRHSIIGGRHSKGCVLPRPLFEVID